MATLGRKPASDDDIELALAATEETGLSAFTLSPGLSPETNANGSERQRLRSGPSSSGFGAGGAAPWHSRPHATWQDRLASHKTALIFGCAGFTAVVLLAMIADIFVGGSSSKASEQPVSDTYAHFYVIGDWGRQGLHNQSEVASVMGNLAHGRAPEFVISTGDNFYQHGLSCVEDDNFRTSFMDVYSASSLRDVPWHAVLGNHDYGESEVERPDTCPPGVDCFWSPIWQLGAGLPKRDPRWHCERSFQMALGDGAVEMFFIDTNPFIASYHNRTWAGFVGGIAQQSWRAQLAELDARLARSEAPWKLVFGHHPVFSSGHHGDSSELVDLLNPVLLKHGVQAYMCGHDHHLEHLASPDGALQYIVSGAGSEVRPLENPDPHSVWGYQGSGFVAATLKRDELDLDFYGIVDGVQKAAYSLSIPRVAK